jgi:SAM-dependent methyltransferase
VLLQALTRLRVPDAQAALDSATPVREHLPPEHLPDVLNEFGSSYIYDMSPEAVMKRGKARAGALLRRLRNLQETPRTSLELGCWDGMTSAALSRWGVRAAAVDTRGEGFDGRATRDGVRFALEDAGALNREDSSVDLVFSFGMLEHVADPAAVLGEATRVLRPGGAAFMAAGPLYLSPWGLHAFDEIALPYCQVLFTESALEEFVAAQGTAWGRTAVNGWRLGQYRELFATASGLELVELREVPDPRHVRLLRRFPSCFRAKSERAEDFVVSHVEALLRKSP